MKENGKKTLAVLAILALAGFAAADPLVIPVDQPICRLYGLIQLFGTVAGVIAAAYAGFQLASSQDTNQRSNAKTMLTGVVLGLLIIWLAPLAVKNLVGATAVCGW